MCLPNSSSQSFSVPPLPVVPGADQAAVTARSKQKTKGEGGGRGKAKTAARTAVAARVRNAAFGSGGFGSVGNSPNPSGGFNI